MTNHIHLLLTSLEVASVSGMMQTVDRRYVHYINTEYKRSGTQSEGRFKSGLIDTDRNLLTCYRYIDMNPVNAGMVESPAEYRWSSYHRNALSQPDGLVVPHGEYLSIEIDDQARRRAYEMLFEDELRSQNIRALHEGTEKGEAISSERFQEAIAGVLKRRVKRVKHGGDRKSEGYRRMMKWLKSMTLTP